MMSKHGLHRLKSSLICNWLQSLDGLSTMKKMKMQTTILGASGYSPTFISPTFVIWIGRQRLQAISLPLEPSLPHATTSFTDVLHQPILSHFRKFENIGRQAGVGSRIWWTVATETYHHARKWDPVSTLTRSTHNLILGCYTMLCINRNTILKTSWTSTSEEFGAWPRQPHITTLRWLVGGVRIS